MRGGVGEACGRNKSSERIVMGRFLQRWARLGTADERREVKTAEGTVFFVGKGSFY